MPDPQRADIQIDSRLHEDRAARLHEDKAAISDGSSSYGLERRIEVRSPELRHLLETYEVGKAQAELHRYTAITKLLVVVTIVICGATAASMIVGELHGHAVDWALPVCPAVGAVLAGIFGRRAWPKARGGG